MDYLDVAQKSINTLAPILGSEIVELPLFVEKNLTAPLAYTTSSGIWLREDVLQQDASNAHIYVMHEIGHHVIDNPELTGMFSATLVNYAEDYWINNHMLLDTFGYDVRKLKMGKLLFNKRLGKMQPHEIAVELYKKQSQYFGPNKPCGCNGIAHPTIRKIANRIRLKYDLGNYKRQGELIVCDKVDDAEYERAVPELRKSATKMNNIRTDIDNLAKGLWLRAFLPEPKPTPLSSVLNVQQTLTYCWDASQIRNSTVNNHEESAIAVSLFLKTCDNHQRILARKVLLAESAISQHKERLRMLKKRAKKARKPVPPRKQAELLRLIEKQKVVLAKRRQQARYPLSVLLGTHPVHLAKSMSTKTVTMTSRKRRKSVREADDFVTVQSNVTTNVLRRLSSISASQLEKLLDFRDTLQKQFGPLINNDEGEEQPEQEKPEFEEPEDEDQNKPSKKEKQPKNEKGQGGSEDSDTDDDDLPIPDTSPKGNAGAAKGNDGNKKTLLKTLHQLPLTDFKLIQSILSYMQEFDTALSVKKSAKLNENINTPAQIPSLGSDLNLVEASDFALLANEATKMLFYSKLADSSLSIKLPQDNKRLPVAMAVDASGSMTGHPYAMACGFVLAMLKKLAQDKRGGAFIVFSSNVTHAITLKQNEPFDLRVILKILLTPKFGGTSFESALFKAYEIKKEQRWNGMTTVLITDGGDRLNSSALETLKQLKTKQDNLTAVLVRGSDSGLMGLNDESLKVNSQNMQLTLTKVGNSIL